MGRGLNIWGKVGGQLLVCCRQLSAISRQFFAACLHRFNTAQLKSFVLRPSTFDPSARLRTSFRLSTIPTLLLFSSCGPDEPEIKFTLTSVLPSPVTPGATVVLYGTLPKDATVKLGNLPLATQVVHKGLQVVLPEQMIAGDHTLSVDTPSGKLTGSVQVIPRIDSAVMSGDQIQVRGAGWAWQPGELAETHLSVDALSLAASLDGASLKANFPASLPYGGFSLRVWVGVQVSEPYQLLREAGAVKGRVILPGNAIALSQGIGSSNWREEFTPSNLAGLSRTTLLVFHSNKSLQGLKLKGLLSVDSLNTLGVSRLRFSRSDEAQMAVGMLEQHPGVSRVKFESLVAVQGSPAVGLTAVSPSVGLRRPSSITASLLSPAKQQWHLSLTGILKAWEQTTGEGIVVGVVDTGVGMDHPDLKDRLLPGYDFVDQDDVPQDTTGHGTHVAGLVAANGGTGNGVLGVAPKAKILPVRVLGASGGSEFTVAQGILWAGGLLEGKVNPNPAQVINLSLGSDSFDSLMAQAVEQVMAKGIIVVAAAGNSGGRLAYPAAFPGVLAVTALAGPKTLYQPWYANRGPGIGITAFGGDTTQDQDGDGNPDGVYSTDRLADGTAAYGYRMGTSMAAPQVSGLVALMLSAGIDQKQVVAQLEHTGMDLGPMGYDHRFGFGLASGAALGINKPRLYAVAVDGLGKVQGWSVVQPDLGFLVSNLKPGASVQVLIAGDRDGDGILAEEGELLSPSKAFAVQAGKLGELVQGLMLSPSNGQSPIELVKKP